MKNFDKIIQSPEALASTVTVFIRDTIESCSEQLGSKKSCSLSNYEYIYKNVTDWLNREYKETFSNQD